MVGGAVYWVLSFEEPAEGLREISALGVEDGEVEEACCVPRSRGRVLAHPGVQADVVVVPTGGEEHRVLPVPLGDLEPQNVPVEPQSALDVGYLEVHVPDAGLGVYHAVGALFGLHGLHLCIVLRTPLILPPTATGVDDQHTRQDQ